MFGKKKAAAQTVTNGRFELEEAGQVAWLEYNLAGNVLQLIHTEVPPALRGKGIAGELAHSALELARERGLKVDVICPSVTEYVSKHPEYAELVLS
ncbi:MAG TPA: GNAT family N-acetyltransferase [Terriglobales bacterium]|nr:GNAT family N-acetyltransferase [Terriglobales bacterium]